MISKSYLPAFFLIGWLFWKTTVERCRKFGVCVNIVQYSLIPKKLKSWDGFFFLNSPLLFKKILITVCAPMCHFCSHFFIIFSFPFHYHHDLLRLRSPHMAMWFLRNSSPQKSRSHRTLSQEDVHEPRQTSKFPSLQRD